jgi:Sec-independent protein secretion pathway component TatC
VKFFSYHQVNILSTIKISFYTGLLFFKSICDRSILFLLPGLTPKETKIFTFITKFTTFIWIRASFSYYTLVPAALNFFLSYSEEVLEPFWSFDQYFEFILVLQHRISFSNSNYSDFNWIIKYRITSTNVGCMEI